MLKNSLWTFQKQQSGNEKWVDDVIVLISKGCVTQPCSSLIFQAGGPKFINLQKVMCKGGGQAKIQKLTKNR